MRRLPPIGALEAFVIVAQTGTLKASSDELNLSISAISRRIQSLESYLHLRLFERLHHEMRLTASGRQLLDSVTPILGDLSRLLDTLHGDGGGRLTIGVAPSFASAWLFPRLADFKARFPTVALQFDSGGSPLPRLGSSLDAAIIFADRMSGDFEFTELRRQKILSVCVPGLLRKYTSAEQAIASCTILLHKGLPEVLPRWLAAHALYNIAPWRIEYFDSGPMLLAAAESGLGLALMLEDSVRFYGGDERLQQPFNTPVESPYSYYLAVRPGAATAKPLRHFCEWIVAEARGGDRNVAFPATALDLNAFDAMT